MTELEPIVKLLTRYVEVSVDKPTPQRIMVSAEILQDYDLDHILAGLRLHFNEEKFFPAPSDIIKRIENKNVKAEEWWNRILNHVRREGLYAGPPNDLTQAANRAMENVGGWEAICLCEIERVPILAKQFREAFRAFDGKADFQRALTGGTSSGRLEALNLGGILKPIDPTEGQP